MRSRLRLGETGNFSDMVIEEVNRISASDCGEFFRYILRNITNYATEIRYIHQ